MADQKAIQFVESVYRRTDKQIRDLLESMEVSGGAVGTEVDTINILVGDGVTPLIPGKVSAVRVDFRSTITGCFIQEFDEIVGSVSFDIAKGQQSPTFAPVSIVADALPTITNGRQYADTDLEGWTTTIERGDIFVFAISTVDLFTRLLLALRINRGEP